MIKASRGKSTSLSETINYTKYIINNVKSEGKKEPLQH